MLDYQNKADKTDSPDIDCTTSKNSKIEADGNRIYFYSGVDVQSSFELVRLLREKIDEEIADSAIRKHEPRPLYLHIHSYGGSVHSCFAVVDVILNSPVPIHTVIDGAAASAGTLMSVVGKKRYMNRNAVMLIHQLSSFHWGNYQQLKDDMKNSKLFMQKIRGIYMKHASIPKKKLKKVLKKDLWWDAEKCLKYNLVDEII